MPLIDNQVTRFENGFTNVPVGNIFNSLRQANPLLYTSFFDDFMDYVPTAWTVTETQAGATQATAVFAGGAILLTNSAADNDINQIQKAAGSILPVVGKKFFMSCRFQLSDVTDSDFAIGIQLVNADGTALATATDGIFFLKADDAATIALYSRQDNTTGSVNSGAIATLVAATNVVLSCFFDGVDRLYYAVDGTIGGYVTVAAGLLPNVACAPIISLKNGAAAAKTATVDYLYVAQEK